ncbi:hypothetical protein OKA04_19105 [Luteolibacter flavescens]|uniref:Uncharacterized protein n=1 Tax=Luteolibacter flavescens TaxID=1859460 RepID=A0ABT3FTF6_9BACT|nr:hypothetical protein [Luteolibacter flavescens]MCW1886856.1 hypothetical protein [Luteolibacter flavescens]
MILPDSLAPFPVPKRDDDPGSSRPEIEDFVTAVDVRKVLLGTSGELPVEVLTADDFDSFAGRPDVHLPHSSRSPFGSGRQVELRVPDLQIEPQTIHPAFDVLPPSVTRRAAPPKAAPTIDCESNYGRGRTGERWWVIGMGLAVAAILMSGTLVDFISREAVRRGGAEAPAKPAPAPSDDSAQSSGKQSDAEIAAASSKEAAQNIE